MKTLYLDGAFGLDVRLDGPALRVRQPGRADGRYPLQRVSRIVAVGPVRWHPEALGACLREHKPVAVLDGRGRFVRALFERPASQFGLARRMAGLLEVPRFRARYEEWFRSAERAEMTRAAELMNVRFRLTEPENVRLAIRREQRQRWGIRLAACYRYLGGLVAGQAASEMLSAGVLGDMGTWSPDEYRMLCDTVRLEFWRQPELLETLLCHEGAEPSRRILTSAFESGAAARSERIAAYRRNALTAMMNRGRGEIATPLPGIVEDAFAQTFDGNCSARVPFGSPCSLRTSVRIMRDYLEFDRSRHALSRAA